MTLQVQYKAKSQRPLDQGESRLSNNSVYTYAEPHHSPMLISYIILRHLQPFHARRYPAPSRVPDVRVRVPVRIRVAFVLGHVRRPIRVLGTKKMLWE